MSDLHWYRNPQLLRAAKAEYGSLEAASVAIGGADASTLQKWWRINGLEKLSPGPVPKAPANKEALKKLYARIYED